MNCGSISVHDLFVPFMTISSFCNICHSAVPLKPKLDTRPRGPDGGEVLPVTAFWADLWLGPARLAQFMPALHSCCPTQRGVTSVLPDAYQLGTWDLHTQTRLTTSTAACELQLLLRALELVQLRSAHADHLQLHTRCINLTSCDHLPDA